MPLGVYIHIPFCPRKCDYCDFFSVPVERRDVPHEAYLAAIAAQLGRELKRGDIDPLEGKNVSSVYFGGGTPSLMPPEFFSAVLSLLHRRFAVAGDAEVSCEVNPATVDAAWFHAARDAGITRCSIGVQSFQAHLLAVLGRIHSAEEAMGAIAQAQDAGFASIGIDLMFAIPGESMADLEDDLRTAMTFQPQHISAYQLTLEEGTPMHEARSTKHEARHAKYEMLESVGNDFAPRASCLVFPASSMSSEEDQLRQMSTVARMLSRGGWHRYEISNFAKPGHECRHNLTYWRYGEWLGLGAGATSFVRQSDSPTVRRCDSSTVKSILQSNHRTIEPSNHRTSFGRRWTQVRDVERYLNGAVPTEVEEIDLPTAMGEFCFLGLRTAKGISPAAFEATFHEPFDQRYNDVCSQLIREGLLEKREERLSLTSRGGEMANQVFARFVR